MVWFVAQAREAGAALRQQLLSLSCSTGGAGIAGNGTGPSAVAGASAGGPGQQQPLRLFVMTSPYRRTLETTDHLLSAFADDEVRCGAVRWGAAPHTYPFRGSSSGCSTLQCYRNLRTPAWCAGHFCRMFVDQLSSSAAEGRSIEIPMIAVSLQAMGYAPSVEPARVSACC
jgi:hypothetical protein